MAEPLVYVTCPMCDDGQGRCGTCCDTGRVIAPASNPASGIGTPDSVDMLREEVRALKIEVDGLTVERDHYRVSLANEIRVNGELADRAARLAGCDCAACVKRAVEEEREACARVADVSPLSLGNVVWDVCRRDTAQSIRARGTTPKEADKMNGFTSQRPGDWTAKAPGMLLPPEALAALKGFVRVAEAQVINWRRTNSGSSWIALDALGKAIDMLDGEEGA